MNEALISLAGVNKSFQAGGREIAALQGLSLKVKAGQVTGLIGPDGAGKTTLMRLLCGLYAPDSGQISVLGHDSVAAAYEIQASVGYMPQRFGLYEDLSVQENLDLYATLQGVPKTERAARYDELMHLTGLGPFTARLAGQLSGGMKQKLGLACTLVRPPPLLLLDEPTVGVDPVSRRELWEIVYRQVRDAGMTVLLSTAYLDEAQRCEEVILLHEGRLIAQDSPDDFAQTVAGRVFEFHAPHVAARRLQVQLSRSPKVLDALIVGENVRLVTHEAVMPTAESLLPGVPEARINPVAANFEDAFIARLKTRSVEPGSELGSSLADNPEAIPERTQTSAQSESEEVIKVSALERRFGDFIAVKGIDFSVQRGEIFGLLGANGAGKSTTFRMLCGLLPASSGALSVAGHDLRKAAARARRDIGYMAQKFSLYGNLTVAQNLRFFASAYGLSGAEQQQRQDWALDTFELRDYAGSNAADLPLGYKQRLSFAAALMHRPTILFLDEPTSGVDPLARREFWARTNALAESGVTILVTTHFMEEANYCDRLVIMADGAVLAAGTPLEMKALARSEQTPDPSMEDAFIYLIEKRGDQDSTGAAE